MIRIGRGSFTTMITITTTKTLRHPAQRWLHSSNGLLMNRLTSNRHNNNNTLPPLLLTSSSSCYRWFTPMTTEEEHEEKDRVAKLTPFEKDMELRALNRQIATLEMRRGINTGELYTWRGKFKTLTRDYGTPFLVWYGAVWCGTLALSYASLTIGGVDALSLLAQIDSYTGWTLAQHVSKEVGTFGLSMVINEGLEPIRLPIVIVTTKPVVNLFSPPKF